MAEATALDSLRQALGYEAVGTAAGNVTVGRGKLDGRPVHVALVESRISSGAIGVTEARRLEALLRSVARERSALVVYLDSAGAKVSEGLAALGAFRRLFRAALDAAAAGAPIAAVLGNNCYGGASMLAHLARERLFSPQTQLAMSGPSVIAAAAGTSALDDAYKAMVAVALTPASRAKASAANHLLQPGEDIGAWLRTALTPPGKVIEAFRMRHEALGARLPKSSEGMAEALRRKDLERIFGEGCDAREIDGLVTGEGKRDGRTEALLGLVSRKPVGAHRAWRFAEQAWKLSEQKASHVHVLLDCESHAPRLDDERIVLSEFIVGMSLALTALRLGGAHVEMTILDRAGGGVYVALAAPASYVSVVYGAHVQVLPGMAIAAILGGGGAEPDATLLAAEAVSAGVADRQLKLGIIDKI